MYYHISAAPTSFAASGSWEWPMRRRDKQELLVAELLCQIQGFKARSSSLDLANYGADAEDELDERRAVAKSGWWIARGLQRHERA